MQDSNHKGNVAEAMIAGHATRLGISVLKPLIEHTRYDLIFDLQPRLLRVQCKWAPLKRGVIAVRLMSTRYKPSGERISRSYTEDQVDAVAAYCEELDECYLLPIDKVARRRQIYLRVSPAKNGQRACLNWACDYRFGAVAQLEERSAGSRKAGGSNPPSSTSREREGAVGIDAFRHRFGWYMERASAGEDFLITRRGKPYAGLGPPQPTLRSATGDAQ